MTSKTKQSGRTDILLRMAPELKARINKAASEDGLTTNDWLLDVIEDALAVRDAEVANNKKRAELERRHDMKYEAIVSVLAAEAQIDRTSMAADQRVELDELAQTEIEKWRSRAASDYYADPRTPIERLCKEYCDIDNEIDGGAVKGIDTSFEIQIDDTDPDDDELDDANADGE
jgi:hypothetical protein